MRKVHIAVCVFVLAVLAFAVAPPRPDLDDFYVFYDSASPQNATQIYTHTEHGGRFLPFLRIPSYAMMLRPISVFPLGIARIFWIGFLLAAFGVFLWLWPDQNPLLPIAMAASVPVMFALQLGQDIALLMLIAAVALRCAMRERWLAAGLVASLGAIKLTFLAPLALVLMAQSAISFLGLAIGTALQVLVSFAATGLDWPRQYLNVLRSPGIDPGTSVIPGFRNIASLVPAATVFLVLAGIAAAYFLIWKAGRQLRIETAVPVAMALGVIAAPHALVYDCALCIPLFLAIASAKTWRGRLALLCLTPIPYLSLVARIPAIGVTASLVIMTAVGASSIHLLRNRETAA